MAVLKTSQLCVLRAAAPAGAGASVVLKQQDSALIDFSISERLCPKICELGVTGEAVEWNSSRVQNSWAQLMH